MDCRGDFGNIIRGDYLVAVGHVLLFWVETCRSLGICKAPHLTERQFLAAVIGAREVGGDEALAVGKEAPIEAEVCIPCRCVEFDTRCGCQPRHEKIPSLNRECPLGGAVAFQFRRINPGEPHRNMTP